jgi:hypothetical protein
MERLCQSGRRRTWRSGRRSYPIVSQIALFDSLDCRKQHDDLHVIELFQSALLSFWDEEEDHHERTDVESCVESEGAFSVSALLFKRSEHVDYQ